MINQINHVAWLKFKGLARQYIARGGLSLFFDSLVVNEYPKSGGSWLAQMLSESLDLPFPRNRLLMLRSAILHGHYLNPFNMKNVVVLWRDGRDVLISHYFHSLFKNERGNALMVDAVRADLAFSDYADIRQNLPQFIEYTYQTRKHPRFSWSDFVNVWAEQPVCHVKYEDLRRSPRDTLKKCVLDVAGKAITSERADSVIEKYSFENQSGRKQGQENASSFMRKGVVGDWRNHFTPQARELFAQYAGEQLITLGYEIDNDWVKHT